MIETFAHKGLKRLYDVEDRSKLPPDMIERITLILETLDAAPTIEAMNLLSFRLHLLKGELKGFWSVTVRANWRIIFRFDDGNA